MAIVFFIGGIICGFLLNIVIEKISCIVVRKKNMEKYIGVTYYKKSQNHIKVRIKNILVILISAILFLISFLQIGLNVILVKALVLNSILIVVSFIDIEHEIIPDKIIIFTLVVGVIFSSIDDISFVNAVGGMVFGGGLMLILALVPGVLGGGDIKLMFALEIFLGFKGTLFALLLAFILASVISILLLLLNIKKRKDYIPFGPFLSLGSFIAFNFISIMKF
ncbi:A24 family peptidase [Clostridium sp.]|uniref:prepilin peptidase n=1 Tax=Clostridium sp. TaxID=1506 RepID=UPI001A5C3645|nr:A24 family peptidase [Clostridium sp.]MBK5241504.1 prepilin peptidase [Clostridium sp.]